MQRFDRYMLSQLMVLFGFFSLVLVSVYWVNRAVTLFDRLVTDGHSAGIFLEFTLLALPPVIAIVLPMAAFAASVYLTNRLSTDSELTVVQATGMSPWRLARPVLVFGVIIAVLMAILTNVLVPASVGQLRERESQIASSLTAKLLHEGTFLHPASGVTFYIRDITPEGELQDVFLSDRRDPTRAITYTADTAYILRDGDETKLVMVSGMAQTLQTEDEALSTTNFTDLTYDITQMITAPSTPRRRARQVSTWELLTDTEAVAVEVKDTPGEVLEEAHLRFQQPILCIVAALIGYAALMVGGYSRFGVTKQIVGAIFLLVLVKLVESAVAEPVRLNSALWPLIYAPGIVGFGIVWALLWQASRPFRPTRAPAGATPEAAA